MRRFGLSLIAILLLAAAGYTGYWFYVAAQLRDGLGPWAEARRAEGYAVRWDSAEVSGFPIAFRLRFGHAVFGAKAPASVEISGPVLVGEAAPWNFKRWRLGAPEGAHVALPAEASALDARTLDGAIAFGAPQGTVVELSAHDLTGGGKAAGVRIEGAEARLTLPAKAPADHRDTALGFAVRLAKLALPRVVSPFSGTVDALSLAATLKGALPPGPLRQALATWRDDGGIIELQDGQLHWGDLIVAATGTLALDEALQPIGALTATIHGHNAIVDAAVATGSLSESDAGLAKAFLGLMAKPGPDGRKQLTLPVSLQNEHVYLGPAEIARLPVISWR